MYQLPSEPTLRRAATLTRRSFTIVEILVAVGIIVLLLAILLAALSKAMQASRRSQTHATMEAFADACQRFQMENGFWPGLVPEPLVAFNNHQIAHGVPGFALSGTENALLSLMGGYALESETDPAAWNALTAADGWLTYEILSPDNLPFRFKFSMQRFGQGPMIEGRQHAPYFAPSAGDVAVGDWTFPQWPVSAGGGGEDDASPLALPDLLDAWDHPIVYLRRTRPLGPVAGDAHIYSVQPPQYYADAMWPYVRAPSQEWNDPCAGGNGSGSVLYSNHPGFGGFPPHQAARTLALLVRSPAFAADPLASELPGTPRGEIFLLSAGADGIYLSATDGPGSPSKPIGCTGCGSYQAFVYEDFLKNGPTVLDLFDDIRVYR